MTIEDFDRMLKDQDFRCAICGIMAETRLDIDHDHVTNRVRGLLCYKCNVGIGHLDDNPILLLNSIQHLAEGEVSA